MERLRLANQEVDGLRVCQETARRAIVDIA